MLMLAIFGTYFAIFKPLTGIKTLQNYFFLVDNVPSFNLVGNMWKSVKNWFQKLDFYLFENEGVDLDDMHILKIGFLQPPNTIYWFAQSWPNVGPKLTQR